MLAVSLAGCAPDLGALPRLNPFSSYASTQSLAPGGAAVWPRDDWWKVYNDTQLNGLVDEALQGSPSLASAQARLRVAEAQARQAGAARLPSVSADAEVTRMKQSYNNGVPADFVPQDWNNSSRAALDFSYDFDFFGKNRAALRAATGEAEAARADAAQARLVLVTSVLAAYSDLARLYADRDAADEALAVRTSTADLFAKRAQNGLEHQGSLSQVQALQASAQAELAALDEEIALTRNRLAALAGQGPDRGLALVRPTLSVSEMVGIPQNLEADLLGRRPDIIAARLRAEAAAQRIKVAKAAYYPNVNLSAYLGYQSLGLSDLTKAGSEIGGIGPAISLPLFTGGQVEGGYRAARAEYDAAVASYNDTLAHALQDVADAATSQRALGARLEASLRALDAAQKAHAIALQRYKGGLTSYLEVLNAEGTLIDNRRAVADLQARAFTLNVAMMKALGGGFGSGGSTPNDLSPAAGVNAAQG